MLRSFQNPAYRFYLPGSLSQFATLSMQIVAGPLLMYRLTGSPALLGTMALVSAFPMIFVSMFGGAVADRIPKKRVVIAGLLGSAVVSFGMATANALIVRRGHEAAAKSGDAVLLILLDRV